MVNIKVTHLSGHHSDRPHVSRGASNDAEVRLNALKLQIGRAAARRDFAAATRRSK